MEKPPLPDAASRFEISKRLDALQRAVGGTQTEFAARAGINPNAWSNYVPRSEKEPRRIEIESAIRLAVTYGITLDYIYLGVMRGMTVDMADKVRAELFDGGAQYVDMLTRDRTEASPRRVAK